MKRFIKYAIRWQLSTLILAPCIILLPFDNVTKTIIANFIGACIFFFVDRYFIWGDNKDAR